MIRTVVVVGAAAVALGGTAAAVTGKSIGRGVQVKGTKIWYAHATARAPRTISAFVAAAPSQPVKVQWAVLCQKPNKSDPAIHLAPVEKSGQTLVRGKASVALALPYPKPPTCVVTVYATLTRAGALTLQLLQT